MNNKEIQNLIKFVAKSGVAEVKLKSGEFAISIKNIPEQIVSSAPAPVAQQPVVAQAPQAVAAPATEAAPKAEATTTEAPAPNSAPVQTAPISAPAAK